MYKVVCGQAAKAEDAVARLEKNVIEWRSRGWKLQGGVSITVTDYGWYIACQAMVQ